MNKEEKNKVTRLEDVKSLEDLKGLTQNKGYSFVLRGIIKAFRKEVLQ